MSELCNCRTSQNKYCLALEFWFLYSAQLCNCRTRFEKLGKASQSGEVDSDEVRSGSINKRRRPDKRAKMSRKSSENQRLKKAKIS